jgi:arsenite methyltransferase
MIATSRFVAGMRSTYAIVACGMIAKRDRWAEWVAQMRPGEDEDDHPHWRWRDRVLDNAEPIAGQTVLDVGCGEGLVALGALDRGAREAVFSDISQNLLDVCRETAAERGVLERCRFVQAPADGLAPVADASIDVVATRSVLIYVADKKTAFREFARVLRPGGRVSLFEPVNRFARTSWPSWAGYDLSPLPEIARKLQAIYDAIQPPDTDPMLDFDERDLLALAEEAGFHPIRLELEAEIRPTDPAPWETFVSRAGNPRIPTLGEAVDQALSAEERDRLIQHLRPLVQEGRGTWRAAVSFLHAVKPRAPGYTGSPRRGSSVGRAHG